MDQNPYRQRPKSTLRKKRKNTKKHFSPENLQRKFCPHKIIPLRYLATPKLRMPKKTSNNHVPKQRKNTKKIKICILKNAFESKPYHLATKKQPEKQKNTEITKNA